MRQRAGRSGIKAKHREIPRPGIELGVKTSALLPADTVRAGLPALPAAFTPKSASFRCRFDRLGDPQPLSDRTAERHLARFEHRIILGQADFLTGAKGEGRSDGLSGQSRAPARQEEAPPPGGKRCDLGCDAPEGYWS